jgi:hypothetical protein
MTASNATPAIVAPAITSGLTGCADVGEVGNDTEKDVGDDVGLESAGLAVGVSVNEARTEVVVVGVLGRLSEPYEPLS